MTLLNHWLAYLLCVLLAFKLSSGLLFTSCGGDYIETIQIEDCESGVTCHLKRGNSYQVYLTPEHISPPLVEPSVQVGLVQIGAYFEQESGCVNQCVTYLTENSEVIPKVQLNISIADNVMAMSSTLRINTTFVDSSEQNGGFCVETLVTVTSS